MTFHRQVIEALKDVDGDRKCFRLMGGVLVERTVKEVLPALQHNNDQVHVHVVNNTVYTCSYCTCS